VIPAASAWHQFIDFPVDDFSVRLLGVRGYHRDEGIPDRNDVGIYDDLIVLCDGPKKCHEFRASVDPGWHYIKNPVNTKGCAVLVPGLWFYKEGMHRGKHTALVQADDVTVERVDREGKVKSLDTGMFGINIHSGGDRTEVDHWSAGCQIIHAPDGAWGPTWLRFLTLTLEAMKRSKQKTVPYLLVYNLLGLPEGVT
jgi:hypothetical protein